MRETTYQYWLDDRPWLDRLIGQRVTEATDDTLTLSNGVQLRFQKQNDDCCSYIELKKLATTDNIITSASIGDDDEGEGEYDAWVHVITSAGALNVAVAHGDASNGYYLHGFALDVTVIEPAVS